MKTHNVLLVLVALVLMPLSSFAVTSPTSVKIQVYGVALSQNTDCSSPVTLYEGTTPTEVDFVGTPPLGTGSIEAGTYPCVIIKMSDVIAFTPTSADGACSAGVEYQSDLCRGNDPGPFDKTEDLTGTVSTCSGTASNGAGIGANPVWLYLSTASTNVGAGSTFRRGATNGISLTSPFVVSATTTGKFRVDFRNKIDGVTNGYCELNPPVFGFSNL